MILHTLQSIFQNYLIDSDISSILPSIEKDTRFSADRRLKIYHDAYRIRLLEILKLDFPKTHTLLGDDEFEKVFITYINKHPSKHFSVRYFGQHLNEFLFSTTPYKNYPVLAEMAQFEWLVSYTLDAKDAPVITIDALSKIPFDEWPELTFTFHPSVISHYFTYDTPQIWLDIENEMEPHQAQLQPSPIRWLFYRKGIRSFFLSCSAIEDKIFQAIANQSAFGDVCEMLIEDCPEDQIPMIVAQTLHKWISEEMISTLNR